MFFWSLHLTNNYEWRTYKTQSTKLQILADQLWCHGWQTCDLLHWHSSSLIKHFVVKRGPLSLGIRSHTCHLRASKSDSGKQQGSHGLWPYELILRQMHSKGTNLKPLLLDQNIMLIFIYFFKHLPYLEDNDRLSKAFNLTKGAILKSYYHDTLVPITHQNKNKQVNKSFK